MDAITAQKEALKKVIEARDGCIDERGIPYPHLNERFNEMVRLARSFKDSIEFMEKLYHPAGQIVPDPHES